MTSLKTERPEIQGALCKVFPCSLRCSLVSMDPTPAGKGSRSSRLSTVEPNREQNHLSALNSLLMLWLKTLAMFYLFRVCFFSGDFVAFEAFSKALMLFCVGGRGLWQHRVNILPDLQYQSDLLSNRYNTTQEVGTLLVPRANLIAKISFHYHVLTAAARFSFWF